MIFYQGVTLGGNGKETGKRGKEPCAARCEVTDELLQLLDVLVDGEFVQAKHDISLRFRGSSNQRLLDVPRTLAAGQPVWWEDEAVFATHTMDRN